MERLTGMNDSYLKNNNWHGILYITVMLIYFNQKYIYLKYIYLLFREILSKKMWAERIHGKSLLTVD